ncbi:CHAT domain-containing protein [Streptomyces sp. NPDC015131]|uniref:CHAT domain-containing protein n=1 Tax=Streptomyces sp. NPDC015131 TaxID=3364941 RepID=UPI0036FBC544
MNTEDLAEGLAFAMEDRLGAFSSGGDPAVLWEDEAERLAERLFRTVDWLAPHSGPAEGARAFNVAVLLATFHWYRFRHADAQADAERAAFLFRLVEPVAPHCVPAELRDAYARVGGQAGSALSAAELGDCTGRAVGLLKDAETGGDPRLLDDAVELCLFAARANPCQEAPDVLRAEALVTLGNVLTRRYEYTGDPDSLDRAFVVTVKGGEAVPEGDPYRLTFCSGLGHTAIRLFQRSGKTATLDLAVRALREAAYRAPEDHPHRAAFLTNLSTALGQYHRHTGRTDAMNEALAAQYEAVRITPRDHPDLPSRLMNLAASLGSHPGTRPPGTERYDAAVALLRDALALTGEGHPDRPGCLDLLAGVLRGRYAVAGDSQDVVDAVAVAREAVRAAAPGEYQRPALLMGLAAALRAGAARGDTPGGARAALTEAIDALREAEALLPDDHPERAEALTDLGFALAARAGVPAHHGDSDRDRDQDGARDRDRARRALGDASAVPSAPARLRVRAAAAAGHLAAGAQDFTGAVAHFAQALEQLELTAWRGLERDDRERLLAEYPQLGTDAAAVAVRAGRPERAVELLEQGRGILLAQSMEGRSDHAGVRAGAPELADRLREVLAELDRLPDRAGAAGGPREVAERRRAGDRRAALAREREEVLAEIRARPGLGGFLRPPPFSALRAVAAGGPVVLVVPSQYGCCALLLTGGGVRPVALRTDARQVAAHAAGLTDALLPGRSPLRARSTLLESRSWLWETVAGPVLAALGLTGRIERDATGPRLWWCPAGLFTLLPLHAAGRPAANGGAGGSAGDGAGDGAGGSAGNGADGDSVADRVVSSYTPTLRALLHARERPGPDAGGRTAGLIVSMPVTPGLADLPAAGEEADALRRRYPDAEFVTGAGATVRAVTDALGRCSWAHFACHGEQDLARPSRGVLRLYDGPLELREVTRLRAGGATGAGFAFLSACETHRGGLVLADEAITFATALQLAGFRDVVATQWSMDDAFAAEVAELVHERLDRVGVPGGVPDPASALHAALWTLRERRPGAVLDWSAYVHVGP